MTFGAHKGLLQKAAMVQTEFQNQIDLILIHVSLNHSFWGVIDNKSPAVWMITWHRTGDKLLLKSMLSNVGHSIDAYTCYQALTHRDWFKGTE